jgi:hypothetical protein
MGVPRIDPKRWEHFDTLRKQGYNRALAARKAGISYASTVRHEKNFLSVHEDGRRRTSWAGENPRPVPFEELGAEAQRAWEDFGYFQRRYFGRIATPWQTEAAEKVVGWLDSPEKEFVVVNAPPGCGKSTTFTLDIPAWVTVRNRAIRGQIGSKVESSARRYVQRLKRAFERTAPVKGESEAVARGLALDAEATLAGDFGVFRPATKELWAADAFVVEQMGGVLIDEKEPTWSAYGMDSGFLGMRYDLIVWDDLVDKLVLRTVESRENQQEWWDDVAEKRLEPAGVLLLQGQRMGADDLYRYALDKRVVEDDEEFELEDGEENTRPQKYHHVVFKAHYDDRCTSVHGRDAAYYPDGCLLDPRRLPWRELRGEMANKRNNFAVIYQQEDVDADEVLVNPLWVSGGTDPRTHEVWPGCLDRERDICDLPAGLHGQLLSIATADPSPTKYWSIQHWVVRCVDGQPQERYLMDHLRQAMDAPAFLDWHNSTQTFIGVLDEWQSRSEDMGLPITTWIIEKNGAQRFLLQYEHVRRWMAARRVSIIPHETQRNKSDPNWGVQVLKSVYKYGLVRLPYKVRTRGFLASAKLIEEVTHWPGWRSDDTVMAQWFLEWHLPHLVPAASALPRMARPSWMRNTDTWGHRRELVKSG